MSEHFDISLDQDDAEALRNIGENLGPLANLGYLDLHVAKFVEAIEPIAGAIEDVANTLVNNEGDNLVDALNSCGGGLYAIAKALDRIATQMEGHMP